MSVLDLVLDDRDFDDLEELARAQLPAKAPRWTDYNLHDPGITLLELVAWVADAQIYSLAHLRRDEREAFARLAGVTLSGPRPATGVIWPDVADPSSGVNSGVRPIAIGDASGVAIRPTDSDRPLLRARHPTLLLPGRIVAVTTIAEDGERTDRTATNARGRPAYLPFGANAGPRDRLRIDFRCNGPTGLADRGPVERSALLTVGVRVADDLPVGDEADTTASATLEATLLVDDGGGEASYPLEVVDDGSAAFGRSGVIALRLPDSLPAAQTLSIELRVPCGFAVPPRVRNVGLNAIAVEEGRRVDGELHGSNGMPDQVIELDLGPSSLRTDGADAPRVEMFSSAGHAVWTQVATLADAEPDDRVYRVDALRGLIGFGNGINGAVPANGAQLFVSYVLSDGAAGNQPRPRSWFAAGLGPIGRSLDPLAGGSDGSGLDEARAAARRRLRERHPLVTADDIAGAALATTALHVARAEVLPFAGGTDVPGTVTLLALRSRGFGPVAEDEPQRWLDAVRAALQSRLPLGQRLVVRGPEYAAFSLEATLRVAAGRDSRAIDEAARAELARRLDPIASAVAAPRAFGLPVTTVDVTAWLRRLDGVAAVLSLKLRDAAGKVVPSIALPAHGLPRLEPAAVTITVVRGSERPT